MIHKFFKWVFRSEFNKLQDQQISLQNQQNLLEDKIEQFKTQMSAINFLYEKCEKLEGNLKMILGNIDVSVDVHHNKYSSSWAVISLQGRKTDYIKFIELRDTNIYDISTFLRKFESHCNVKVDAEPTASQWLKIKHK